MIDQERTTVYCNNLTCDNHIVLPAGVTSDTDIRMHIWDAGWLIDLHSQRDSLLASLQVDSRQTLLGYATRTKEPHVYIFEQDQHYCSIPCVEQDTD